MPSRPQRGQGQWALGHHEPLNAAERFKKDDDGLHVRDRILSRYAFAGFDSIDPADLRGRFRWWGLYTQRRPGISGGRTGTLDDADIEDSYFMMRVRIPGGQLSAGQLRAVAGIAKEYGRDLADITDRQNVQYHWIRIEDVPAIWQRLDEVGLSSLQACGDVPRNILGCPVAGLDATEVIDATAALRATEAVAAANPEFTNLPRKFKTAISGCSAQCIRMRSTTSRSSASPARTAHQATTCGSAAACPPTRCSPSDSASSSRRIRYLRYGRPSPACSVTMVTAACAAGPG